MCYKDALGIEELNQEAKCYRFFHLCPNCDNIILSLWRMNDMREHLVIRVIWYADVCRLDL